MKQTKTKEENMTLEEMKRIEWESDPIVFVPKFIFKAFWIGVISLFYTITSVAFGLASILLLLGLIVHFKVDYSTIEPLFMNLMELITDNLKIFGGAIFIYEFLSRWRIK